MRESRENGRQQTTYRPLDTHTLSHILTFFGPTGVKYCTNGDEIWHAAVDIPLLYAKLHPISAGMEI